MTAERTADLVVTAEVWTFRWPSSRAVGLAVMWLAWFFLAFLMPCRENEQLDIRSFTRSVHQTSLIITLLDGAE